MVHDIRPQVPVNGENGEVGLEPKVTLRLKLSAEGKKPASSLRGTNLAWIIHDFASEKRKGALKD
jgi:hypothetical protein